MMMASDLSLVRVTFSNFGMNLNLIPEKVVFGLSASAGEEIVTLFQDTILPDCDR